MNEQELRHAMRGAMSATQAPPPMNPTPVLDAARRAHRNRRATLAGAASSVAVVLVAVAAMLVPSVRGGGSAVPGGRQTGHPTSPPGSETSWPNGQTDRTASQGPRFDVGVQLMNLLLASLPAGFSSPPDLQPAPGVEWYGGLRMHQAQFADRVGGREVWEYLAVLPVGGNGKWGRVAVEVHTPGNEDQDDGCALTARFWGLGGNCQLVSVGDRQIGVSQATAGDRADFDQWAGYRYPDGTVVFVAQATTYAMSGLPEITALPYTPQQLAALAMDPRFHLG
jgi:hypothetical protein